jgi:hypothetical protein
MAVASQGLGPPCIEVEPDEIDPEVAVELDQRLAVRVVEDAEGDLSRLELLAERVRPSLVDHALPVVRALEKRSGWRGVRSPD